MKIIKNKHIAMCGLECSSCPMFIVAKNNDQKMREKVAREWTVKNREKGPDRPPLKPEDIDCHGCLSEGHLYLYCRNCEIRKCGLERQIKNCGECQEYRCDKLIELHKRITSGKEICDKVNAKKFKP